MLFFGVYIYLDHIEKLRGFVYHWYAMACSSNRVGAPATAGVFLLLMESPVSLFETSDELLRKLPTFLGQPAGSLVLFEIQVFDGRQVPKVLLVVISAGTLNRLFGRHFLFGTRTRMHGRFFRLYLKGS